jgi:hypothetical protein
MDPETPWKVKAIDGDTLTYLVPDVQVRTNAGKMSATGTITTERLDLDADIVRTKGGNLSVHERNPQVLLVHNQGLPCGKAKDPLGQYTVKMVGDGRMDTETFFHKRSRLGEEAFRLAEEEIFRGYSIGFPRNSAIITKGHNTAGQPIKIYESWTLLEYSLLPFPSNPDCLISRVEKGYGGRKLSPELDALLRPFVPARPALVPSGFQPTVEKGPMNPRDTLQSGAAPDPMAPVDAATQGAVAEGAQEGDTPDVSAGPDAHKQTVDNAVADMMASIYVQFTDGVIDQARALAMFQHLLETHGTVSGSAAQDDLAEDPDAADIGADDADADGDSDADGDGVPDDEDAAPDDKDEKAFRAFEVHYQPKMSLVWEFLRRVESHPKLSVPKVRAKAGEFADLMETLPPIEKAIQDGSLVLKAARPAAPAEPAIDYAEELEVARTLADTLYAVTGIRVRH